MNTMTPRLAAESLELRYDDRVVVPDLSVAVPEGRVTVIVGPNACGKSTLLRALARILRPSAGQVLLDGRSIHESSAKSVARRLGMLPQSPVAPEGITVLDLAGRGRYPHQSLLRQWSDADQQAAVTAMGAAGVTELADRPVDELSGGQRQRVWLAMALAQDTRLLLLDEPTTLLDIAHQLDVLDLCSDLRTDGYTIVAVLHDLNQACRYADHLIAMKDGRIVAEGAPAEIVTPTLVTEVFGVACSVIDDPATGTPLVVPDARRARPVGAVQASA